MQSIPVIGFVVSGSVVLINNIPKVTIAVSDDTPAGAVALLTQSTGAYLIVDPSQAVSPFMSRKFSLLELANGGFVVGCAVPGKADKFDVLQMSGDTLMRDVDIAVATPILSIVFVNGRDRALQPAL